MIWLTGVLLFVVGIGLCIRGANLLSAGLRSGEASFRFWAGEFWFARPGFPAMGLGPDAQWVVRLFGGFIAMVVAWRLVRIAGRID
jgi:hypothetical protein